MPSSATTRNRLEKQATGENTNTWGSKLNSTALDLIDYALDGRVSFTLSGTKTLTSTNFTASEAIARYIDVTGGTGGTITIPAVEKLYFVRNNSSGNVVLTTGGSTNATIATGLIQWVVCDGTNVRVDGSAAAAAASAAAAAASAASINDTTLIHTTGNETLGGTKTFSSPIVASGGVTINSQTLDALSANGCSLIEAANYSAMRTLLSLVPGTDVQAYSAILASLAGLTLTGNGLKAVRVNSSGNALELATSTTVINTTAVTNSSSTTPASFSTALASGTMVTGGTYRITVRGIYSSTTNTTGLGLALSSTGSLIVSGAWRVWSSSTSVTEGPISSGSDSKSFSNVAANFTGYPFEVSLIVSQITTATLELKMYNTAGASNTTSVASATMVVERLA